MLDPVNFQHIYIHWPFCKKRCHYCDFVALAQHESFFESYHKALCKEIELVGKSLNSRQAIKTVFLGGGTPSLYPTHMLEEVFKTLNNYFDLSEVQEVTIEANPADITEEKLSAWKSFGINRLSMGVQILDDEILKNLNRSQTTTDVLNAIEIATKFFENISIDLILGLPGITEKIWNATMQQAVAWPINHISVYFLTVYEKTPLYFKVKKGELKLFDDEQMVSIYSQTIDFLEKNNFFQYEISNFAKEGYESVHNQAYWNRKSYYGFGLGASSFDGEKRFTNFNNIETYTRSIVSESKLPIAFTECLTRQQVVLEMLMLSLRQKEGLDLHSVLYLLTGTQKITFNKNIELLKSESLLQQDDNRLFLSFKGIVLENEVVLKLSEGLF